MDRVPIIPNVELEIWARGGVSMSWMGLRHYFKSVVCQIKNGRDLKSFTWCNGRSRYEASGIEYNVQNRWSGGVFTNPTPKQKKQLFLFHRGRFGK